MKQIIHFLSVTFALLHVFAGFAQTEINTSFSTQMNTVFANLDKTKVPYGYLRDYAMEFTNLENYNGKATLADSNLTDMGNFWEVYNTLISA
jgi:hypothetical protein